MSEEDFRKGLESIVQRWCKGIVIKPYGSEKTIRVAPEHLYQMFKFETDEGLCKKHYRDLENYARYGSRIIDLGKNNPEELEENAE